MPPGGGVSYHQWLYTLRMAVGRVIIKDHFAGSVNAAMATEKFIDWKRNARALALASVFHALGVGMVHPFLPLIFQEMGAQGNLETWVGYGLGGYFGLSFFLTPFWGGVGDYFGRKPMVLRTSLGMGLVYGSLAFMPGLGWMLGLYIMLGTTNGFVPNTQALIATNTPNQAMGHSLSLVHAAVLIGSTLGPAVGAVLVAWLPAYRYLFLVCGGLILSSGFLVLLLAREQHQRPAGPFRLQVWQDLRMTLRLPRLGVLMFVQFLFSFVYMGSTAIVSVFALELLTAREMSDKGSVATWVGVISLAMTLASALAAPLWGRLIDRIGAPAVLALGLCCAAAGSLPMILVQSPLQLLLARIGLGALAVGIAPASIVMMKTHAPAGKESQVMAFGAACGALGVGVGPFVAGQIGPIFGLRTHFGLNALLLLIGMLLWLNTLRHAPGR